MARRSQTPPPQPEKSEAIQIVLPEGRLINHALFEKDTYVDEKGREATPQYKIEIAFDPADLEKVIDQVFEECKVEYGDDAILDLDAQRGDTNVIVTPFLDGDKLARKREERGKEGNAYKGKLVIRANTLYNKDGVDGPGGVAVYDEDVKELAFTDRGKIYPGMFGIAAVNLSFYENNRGEPCCKFYLSAFQRTKDGDKLSTGPDRSQLFKPVGRAATAGGAGGGRRSRAG